jgi:hypothetical protein
MLIPIYEHIPDEIKALTQWVTWRSVPRKDGGKPTKPPYQPGGKLAKTDDSWTWSSFETIKAAADQFDGIGFVLTQEMGIVGLGFDQCRCPAFDGVTPWAYSLDTILPVVAAHIRKLNSYTEVSPLRKGIRAIVKGKLPDDWKKNGEYEVYQAGQYLAVTGHVLDRFPRTIERRQEELDAFLQTAFGAQEKPPEQEAKPRQHTLNGDWKDRLEKAFKSKYGAEINDLYYCNKPFDNPSHENDLALCSHLAFWLDGDPALIDSAFRDSWRDKDKWDQKHDSDARTYGQVIIEEALKGCQSFYGDQPQERCEAVIDHSTPPPVAWPNPLDEAAFHGLAGEWVSMIIPNTEADPAALLFQFHVSFGNIIGRSPFFMVEATEHHTNEFLLLVGRTSKGRKGTSWDHARRIAREIDPHWESDCIKSGLVSGEGLIYHVRDNGVEDKRLVVYEPEFASVLKIIERKDNTLSTAMRQSWDHGRLRTMAKNSAVTATDAHISIVSHITKEELRRRLSDTELFNGFANRFMFVCVQRSKLLPEGGGVVDLSGILPRIQQAVEFARNVGEMRRDEEARAVWCGIYEHLTRDQPGILGAVLSREAAHVVRLSMNYALLNCSATIRREHLMAALACWEYCDESARFIFDSMTGDPQADKIYEAVWAAGDAGISKKSINDTLFNRNQKAARIDEAINILVTMGKVRIGNNETGGRPETRIYARQQSK